MEMKLNKTIINAIARMKNEAQGKKDDKWSRPNHFNVKWGYWKSPEFYDEFQGKIGNMSFEYKLLWPENRDAIDSPNGTFDMHIGDYEWCKDNLIYPENVIALEVYNFSCRNIMKLKEKSEGYITKECLELLDLFEKDNSNIEFKKHISIAKSRNTHGTKSDIGEYIERHRYFVPIYSDKNGGKK
tara:strand:+ start:45 stop:599 length:555 start_codon:yes stop_codon:yes gene_type:complete